MTPQMEPLWRWSPRVEPREDTMKEKKEREKEWGKEKNNYTVRESVSMKVCSPIESPFCPQPGLDENSFFPPTVLVHVIIVRRAKLGWNLASCN